MTEFRGDVTISAQGLYDLLTEHIQKEPAARIVASLQARQPEMDASLCPANDAEHSTGALEAAMHAQPEPSCYVNIANGLVMRVAKVDESYAHIVRLDGKGRWQMPIADYRSEKFSDAWRPATADEIVNSAGILTGT